MGTDATPVIRHAIIDLLKREHVTQTALAAKLGVTQPTVSRLLSERRRRGLTETEVADIENALGLPDGEVFRLAFGPEAISPEADEELVAVIKARAVAGERDSWRAAAWLLEHVTPARPSSPLLAEADDDDDLDLGTPLR